MNDDIQKNDSPYGWHIQDHPDDNPCVIGQASIYDKNKNAAVADVFLTRRLDLASFWHDGEVIHDPSFTNAIRLVAAELKAMHRETTAGKIYEAFQADLVLYPYLTFTDDTAVITKMTCHIEDYPDDNTIMRYVDIMAEIYHEKSGKNLSTFSFVTEAVYLAFCEKYKEDAPVVQFDLDNKGILEYRVAGEPMVKPPGQETDTVRGFRHHITDHNGAELHTYLYNTGSFMICIQGQDGMSWKCCITKENLMPTDEPLAAEYPAETSFGHVRDEYLAHVKNHMLERRNEMSAKLSRIQEDCNQLIYLGLHA